MFHTKTEVEAENNRVLENLPGEQIAYTAIDGGQRKHLLDTRCPAPQLLSLKVGAPVMLIKNYPNIGLVNGSMGKVIGFVNNFPNVQFENRTIDKFL